MSKPKKMKCPKCGGNLRPVRTHPNDDDVHYTCKRCGRDFDETGREL